MDLRWIWGGSEVDLGWIWGGSGVDFWCTWVDLGWIWDGPGVDLGCAWVYLGGSGVSMGRMVPEGLARPVPTTIQGSKIC